MASATPLPLILLTLTSILLLLLLTPQTHAQAPAPAPSGPVNLTGILDKGGQYTTLISLLSETRQGDQIQNQLNTTTEGFTLFAPTDNAFQNLESGAINDLTGQQKIQLVQYHITPKFYTLSQLLTVSNPVITEASPWGLNFSGRGNQVNVSTGVVETPVNNALRQQSPLAVYQVDRVLLPLELFGADSPSSAPSPKSSGTTPSPSESSGTNNNGTDESPSPSNENNDANGRNVDLGLVVGLSLICLAAFS